MVIQGRVEGTEGPLSQATCTFPSEVNYSKPLLSCPSPHTVNKRPFHGLFYDTFFTFVCFLLMIVPLNMVHSDRKVLSSAPDCRRTLTSFMEKTNVLGQFRSIVRDAAV